MRLNKVTLNNYRCFEHLEVDLHPPLTVLVGENGAGKTAILDGIAAALSRVLRHLSSANQRLSAAGAGIKDTDFRIESWEDGVGRERWGVSDYVQVIAETTDGLQWDYWRRSAAGKEPPHKIGEAALASYLSRLSDSLKDNIIDRELLPVFAYYGAQRGSIEIPERLRSSTENYSHPTSALIGALDASSNFKEMLKWFDAEEASELRDNIGQPIEHYSSSYELSVVRNAIESLLGGVYLKPRFNKDHKFLLDSSLTGKPLQVSQLSHGYLSMLALGMDFARRLALANSPMTLLFSKDGMDGRTFKTGPAIMLVDEIDLHLHPTWQQRVLGDLMRAFPGTQFIVTTHSPQVLTTVPAECIRIIKNELNPISGQIEYWIDTPAQQTQGVSSADVLASTMAVDPVPNIDQSAWLSEYRALIQQGLQDSPEGLALKEKLINHFGPRHPEILDCERMIRLEEFKRKLPSPGKMPLNK